jgi:Lipocalin-like domain
MKPTAFAPGLCIRRILFLLVCIFSFTACIPGNAHAIVGKWKGGSAKIYYSAEYAKEKGKAMEEMTAAQMGNYVYEFKSDNRFVETMTSASDPKLVTMNGTWNLTGDKVQITLEPKFNPQKTTTTSTVAISGNTMVNTSVMPPGSRIVKMISTSTRM